MWLYYRTLLHASIHTVRQALPLLAASARDRLTHEETDRRAAHWARILLQDVSPKLTVTGHENLLPAMPMIIMSNHLSLYDIPVLFESLGIRMRMLAKKELFRIPIFGPAMRAAGFIPVDRNNRERAIESVHQARRLLESGISVYLAPEGTRSRTGELLPFKKGGFILSLETGLPILPISIRGTEGILPARTRSLNRGCEVHVTIHPRIDPKGLTREELMARVRQTIESGLRAG